MIEFDSQSLDIGWPLPWALAKTFLLLETARRITRTGTGGEEP